MSECPNRPEWAEPNTSAISPDGFCFQCSRVRGEWVRCEGDFECGWCHGTGIHYYNTDDMDRLTMPCPNRNCPKSPDWWHLAADANAEDEAREKRSRTRDQ